YQMAFPPYVPDHTFPNTSNAILLTSKEEIARLMSTQSIRQHVDDLDEDHENHDNDNALDVTDDYFLAEVIQRASSRVMERLAPRFKAENIYQTPRIREIATYFAAHDITRRRGNDPIYEHENAAAED